MIGIRCEDKNAWERRAPLTPDHVAALVERHGIEFVVEACARRAFPDSEYEDAGARVRANLDDCRLLLGVKEIPIERLSPGRTYLCFSHTTKGQGYNLPLLERFLDLGCTLIDYEHIVDRYGRRLIFFGRHAGYAGMLDALWALGRRLAAEGIPTPFARVRLAHEYESLDQATRHVWEVGQQIRHDGLPDRLRPLVCAFTGSGNVTQGALEIIQRLPTIEVVPAELTSLIEDDRRCLDVIYTLRLCRHQRYRRAAGGPFDAEEFRLHPERYESTLPRWLGYLTLLVHGAWWHPEQPRILTFDALRREWSSGEPRLRVIADVSCDISGAIESTVRATSPGEPAYVYDVLRNRPVEGMTGSGPVMLAVDNLPCQLPVESSQAFGDALVRFVPALAACNWDADLDSLDLPDAIRRAIVTHKGQLAPDFAHLQPFLEAC